jgi:hypothetical protein
MAYNAPCSISARRFVRSRCTFVGRLHLPVSWTNAGSTATLAKVNRLATAVNTVCFFMSVSFSSWRCVEAAGPAVGSGRRVVHRSLR